MEQCRTCFGFHPIEECPLQPFEDRHLFSELLTCCFADDLAGIEQSLDSLNKMAERFSEWVPIVHYARGEYRRLRGELAQALVELEKAFVLTGPGQHVVWPHAAGAHIKTLFKLNRLQEAAELGLQYLDAIGMQDSNPIRHYIGLPLSLVEARRGDEDKAIKHSADAIEQWNALGVASIVLGSAYEVRARVALFTDNVKSYRTYAELCGQYYRADRNEALAVKYQKFMRDARRSFVGASQELQQVPAQAPSSPKSDEPSAPVTAHIESSSTSKNEGRYFIEVLLGKGGMASVYRVRDRETGTVLALKRAHALQPDTRVKSQDPAETIARKKRQEQMLRREYQTLKSLGHPRIVEVYDFGVDQEGAYYTMELLEGKDFRQLAPLEWKPACVLLKDLASALALLHSRRLLHRDLSPRNVRVTADGRVKLMDFGAMAPMGLFKESVGTPPFVPPEAIYSQHLDQRSDLYSLGALAYWLLTGQHAYPVRRPRELREAWRNRPQLPSQKVEEIGTLDFIPEALDRLVMSLLSLDPLARPRSAAEVMERLGAIAELPADERLAVPQAYLTTPTLVGRFDALLTVRKRVIRSLRHRGGAIVIEGPEGVGRSRFLDACVMEGKLAGVVVLRADAKDGQWGPYGVAQTLIRQLITEIPEVALEEAKPYRQFLRLIVPELFAADSDEIDAASSAGDQSVESLPISATDKAVRPKVQEALLQCVLAISKRRALLLAIDDIHRIDEPSLAFLAVLTHDISRTMLALTVTAESGAQCTSDNALSKMRKAGTVIELENLNVDDTEKLLFSVFGDVPNVRLLADRIYTVSQGNPRMVMQIAQHLVDQGVVRYESGAWSLPSALDAAELPTTLKEALKEHLERLDIDALKLGQTMALSLEERFSFEQCLVLSERRDPARLMQYLDALVASDILSTDGKCYAFRQQRWVTALLEDLTEDKRRELHLRLAALYQGDQDDQWRLAQHLLYAGEEERALSVFIRYVEKLRELFRERREALSEFISAPPRDWENTVSALLQICKKRGDSRYHIYLLQYVFLLLSSVLIISDNSCLFAIVSQVYHDTGLDIYQQLGDIADPQERFSKAFEQAQQRYESLPAHEKVLSPIEAIGDLTQAVLIALSIAGTSLDYELLNSLPSVEPLIPLSPAFGILQKNVQSSADVLGARLERARRGYLEILERINEPDRAGLPETFFNDQRYAVAWVVAVIEASWGLKSTLDRADELESSPAFKVNAWRARMLYHLRQGDIQKAGQCKKQLELLQIQNSVRYFDGTQLLSEVYVYSFSEDLTGVKQTLDDIEILAKRFVAWIPVLHFARGEYHRIRGDYSSAIEELERALGLVAVGRHLLWPYVVGAYINALYEAGRFQDSQTCGRKLLAEADAADLGRSCNYIRGVLARAEAKFGQYERAVSLSESAIESWKAAGTTGLHLGLAYESRARVALLMNDEEAFRASIKSCAEQYRRGSSPALAAKYAALIREAQELGIEILGADGTIFDKHNKIKTEEDQLDIGATIERLSDPQQRAERILEILTEDCNARGGYLFGLREDGVRFLSSGYQEDNPEQLAKLVETYLEAELDESSTATVTVADENAANGKNNFWILDDGRSFQFLLLYNVDKGRTVVTGIAAMLPKDKNLRPVTPGIIHAISENLLKAGDVVPRYAAA